MANANYTWKGNFSLESLLSSLQNLKAEAASTDKVLEELGDGVNLGKLVKQISQLNKAIDGLKQDTNSLKSGLGKSLEGGYIKSLDEALGKMATLSELSQTIFKGLGDINLKDSDAPKQLEKYAKQLNLLFSNLGIDNKIDLNLFNTKDVQAQFNELLNFTKNLNNHINIALGSIDSKRLESELTGAFSGASSAVEKEIKKLKQQEKEYQAILDKFQEVSKMKKKYDDGDTIPLDFKITSKVIDELIEKYKELNDVVTSLDPDSVEYADKMAERAKVALQLFESFNQTSDMKIYNFMGELGTEDAIEEFSSDFKTLTANIRKNIKETQKEITTLQNSTSQLMDGDGTVSGGTGSNIDSAIAQIGDAAHESTGKINALHDAIKNVFRDASALEVKVGKGEDVGKEYMNLFSADGTVSTVSGIGSKIDTDAIVGQMVASLRQNMVMSLHNHAHGATFFSPADIESFANLYYGQGTKINGIIADGLVRTIDFTGVSQETAKQIATSYQENLRRIVSNSPQLFSQDIDNIGISDAVKALESKSPETYHQIVGQINEAIHSALTDAITKSGVDPDSIIKVFNEAELPKLSQQLLDIQQSGQGALSPVEKLKNLLTTISPDIDLSKFADVFEQFEKGAIDGSQAMSKILDVKTVGTSMESVAADTEKASVKLEEFYALTKKIQDTGYMTDIDIGQNLEKLDSMQNELKELAAQGKITEQQMQEVNAALDKTKGHLNQIEDNNYNSRKEEINLANREVLQLEGELDSARANVQAYQEAYNEVWDEKWKLERENESLREQLNKSQQDTSDPLQNIYDTQTGQLAMFEGMTGAAQEAKQEISEVGDALKEIVAIDGQVSLFEDGDVNKIEQEAAAHKENADAIREETDAKNAAQSEEVKTNTDEIVQETQAHEQNTQTIKEETDAKKELNATQDAGQSKANADEIKQETQAHEKNTNAIKEETAAQKELDSAKSKNSKNTNFGSTAAINATAKYNTLLKELQYDAGSKTIGNPLFGNSSVVQTQLAAYISAYEKLIQKRKELANSPAISEEDKIAFKELQDECTRLAKALEQVVNASKKLSAKGLNEQILGDDIDATDLEQRKAALIDYVKEMYGASAEFGKFSDNFEKLNFTVKNGDGTFTKMTASLNEAKTAIVSTAQAATKLDSSLDKIKGFGKGVFSQFANMYLDLYAVISLLRQGVESVREIDLAMTELKKVTDETADTYARFLDSASERAGKIGSTVKDFTTATSDFARLGYDINEAANLAEAALVYENVGDGFSSVEEASESVISTMKAFGIEANDAISIVDKFNEVGNNFAITSKGIGDALQRSASSLFEAGNTLDESIGLITGMNTVVQDPAQVGTALKTLTMRLRGAKVELEEAGLDAEGMATSTSKLREQLIALTGVDIMLDENTFKSTTQILREMSKVWTSLDDIDAAAALELMGGKRQANILASALKNWDEVERAIATASGSAGSAMAENAKYMESLQGHIDQFNNALQTMWNNLLDSEMLKGIVDIGTALVKAFDTGTGKVLALVAALHLVSKFKLKTGGLEQLFGLGKTKIGGDFIAALQLITGVSKGKGLKGLFSGIKQVFGGKGGFGSSLLTFFKGNWFTVVLAAIPLVIAGINKIKNASAELKKEVQDLTSTYKEQQKTVQENLDSLTKSSDPSKYKTLQDEFNKLSMGVDEHGNNVSLAADEYERYREICETIIAINPSLVSGDDSATEAIGRKTEALEELIEVQKEAARQEAEEYTSTENLEKMTKSAVNDYKAAQKQLDKLLGRGSIVDAYEDSFKWDTTVSKNSTLDDEAIYNILKAINPTITPEEVKAKLIEGGYISSSRYAKGNNSVDISQWVEDNIDYLRQYRDLLPSEIANLVSEISSAQKNLESAKQGMVDALIEVPKAMDSYADMSDAEKSFISGWIKDSEMFEINQGTTTELVLGWKQTIRDMVKELNDDTLTTTTENGTKINASDILDSIYDLDPSSISFASYKTEMGNLIDLFWDAIDGDNNKFKLKEDDLAKMFGFDEKSLQEQEDFMYSQLEKRILKDDPEKLADIKKRIEGMDAVQVQRLLEVDWNVVDAGNIDQVIGNALVDDFTFKNFGDYSEHINLVTSNISTLQGALESLESGSFSHGDFIELISQYPELAEGVDLASGSFKGLAKNLQKAISKSPDGLIKDLKELREQLVGVGKDTTAIDQLIESVENLPTTAIDSAIAKYGLLADEISEANAAQSALSAAMSEDPDANYQNTSQAMQQMKDLIEHGVVGSESKIWDIYEALTGKSYDYQLSVEQNKQALQNWINTYDRWYLGQDDEEYSTAGITNFLNDVETRVASAKASGEEWAKDIVWSFENGIAKIDWGNTSWDDIAAGLGITTEMFADLMMRVAQFIEVDWTTADDMIGFFDELAASGKSVVEQLSEADAYIKGFLQKEGVSLDWLDGSEESVVDGIKFENLSEDIQGVLQAYWDLQQVDPLEITVKFNEGDFDAAISSLNQLVDTVHDTDTGTTWLSFDELKKAAKAAGYSERGINALVDALEAYGDKILDLKITDDDPLGLLGMRENVDAAVNYLNALDVQSFNIAGDLHIDLSSFVTQLKNAEMSVEQTRAYIDMLLGEGFVFTDQGQTLNINSNAEEVHGKVTDLYNTAEQAPDEQIKINVTGNAESKLDSIIGKLCSIQSKTVYVTTVYREQGSPSSSGGGGYTLPRGPRVNGSAHASGDWGLPKAEHNALVGELGQELVVDPNSGMYYTVGDRGAEMVDLPKDAIIFNHKQTEALLKHGYVTGRGKAYASGTAHANIFQAVGNWVKTTVSNVVAAVTGNNAASTQSTPTKSTTTTTKPHSREKRVGEGTVDVVKGDQVNTPAPVATSYNAEGPISSGGGSGGGNGGGYGGGGSSGGGSSSNDAEEPEESTLDFIEFKIEEIEALIEKITAKIALFLDDTSDIIEKDSYYDQLVEAEKNKAETYLSAAEVYNQKAAELLEEVPSHYHEFAQNGALAIEDFIGEEDQEIVDAINEYREFAQKADEAEVGYLESVAQAAAYRVEQLDDIATDFENLTNQIETQSGLVDSHMNLIEESGNIISEKFYQDLMSKTIDQRKELKREKKALQKILDDSVRAGDVIVGTDEWFEMVQAIYDVDEAIVQCDIDLESYQNSINELNWESFERLLNQLDEIDSELSFIADLMTKNDWEIVDEDSNWTDKGITALGMYAQQMELAQTKSQQYGEEIKELDKLYKKGLISETEYTEKLAELKEGQRDAIGAYEDAKDAIVDLNKVRIESIKEGLDKELEAYQELIEKKKEALEADRDLYDFEKNVAEQQKNIADIQRKIAALSGDNSLSATAQRRKLEAELLEAQAELEDTYRDRQYDNTINALDKESEAYAESIDTQKEALDKSLENVDAIVTESLGIVRVNTENIMSELTELSKTYSIQLSEEITAPWEDGTAAISAYRDSFVALKDSFSAELAELIEQEKELQEQADKSAAAVLSSISKNESTVERVKNPKSSSSSSSSSSEGVVSGISGDLQYGDEGDNVKALQRALNSLGFKAGTVDGIFGDNTREALMRFQSSSKYGGAIDADGIVGAKTKKKFNIAGYAKGTTGLKKDQWAWIDEIGEELILVPGPNGTLSHMVKGTGIVPADITKNLMALGQLDPTEMLKRSTPRIGAPHITNTEINLSMDIGSVVNIEHVDHDTIPDLTKAVEKQMDKYMKNLNQQIRKFSR